MNHAELMQKSQIAVQAYQRKELDEAEIIFKQILAVNPREPNALHLLGCIHKDRGQLQQAIDLIEESIRVDDSNPIPFLNLGKILSIAGQYEKAAGVLQESLQRNQQIPESWFCLANALRELEKTQEAIRAYRKVLLLNPAHAGAGGNLGALLSDEGEFDEAGQVLVQALAQNPQHVICRINYGKFFGMQGKHPQAIEQYMMVLSLVHNSAELYSNYADSLREEGAVEEAIVNYRKAIEVKPDFWDACLKLANLLKGEGLLKEAGIVVSAFLKINRPETELVFSCHAKSLVFDWHHRRAMLLCWTIEFESSLSSSSASASVAQAVSRANNQIYPPLFIGEANHKQSERQFYAAGYIVQEGLIPGQICAEFINRFCCSRVINYELIELVYEKSILTNILEHLQHHSGLPHLVWNCEFLAKGADDISVSDVWHYDNHYNPWTPKLMVYLNSQRENKGATEFVDANISSQLSDKSDYMGIVGQRESYSSYVSGLAHEFDLDSDSLDPPHYTFSPDKPGTGVWFCPARVLHRGVSPRQGLRYLLSFSMTPVPLDIGWSVCECVEKSVEILRDKIKQGMQESDANPYWLRPDV